MQPHTAVSKLQTLRVHLILLICYFPTPRSALVLEVILCRNLVHRAKNLILCFNVQGVIFEEPGVRIHQSILH